MSKKKNFSYSIQSAIRHSKSFRGYHNTSLLLSPQVSLTVAPFLGAPGGDQSPLRPVRVGSSCGKEEGVGSSWGKASPTALPYPVAIPGELVHPSNESVAGRGTRSRARNWTLV